MEINKISYVKNLSSRKSPKIFDIESAKIDTLENQAVIEIVHKFVHKMRVCELFLFYYTLCASAG